MTTADSSAIRFTDLDLPETLIKALADVGYESPSPIQAATIPPLLEGRHVLGQAQTGTGKTAAFALPILARIDVNHHVPQALVLTPTRELAIQVAEAFQKYATHIRGFSVLPVYGGQAYGPQLTALRRGVSVIVGTPGRMIDHLDRGSLKLDHLKTLVLDEADEMLRMGFIDDVEKILQKTPGEKQVALFSATMPPAIKRIANTYLKNPAEITIAAKTRTATTVKQRVLTVIGGMTKLEALTRILEVEPFEGMIVFTRTKIATEELASKLAARGFNVAALNGDVPQATRERTVMRLKSGSLDIVVATDVAARGLDVERITHVVNYDPPTDPESYVHRIGRTGRAGRSGEAILFIQPRERGLLKMIERSTRQPIENFVLPSDQEVGALRREKFKQKLLDTVSKAGSDLSSYRDLLSAIEQEGQHSLLDIAAALAKLVQGNETLPTTSSAPTHTSAPARPVHSSKPRHPFASSSSSAPERSAPMRSERPERPARPSRERGTDEDKETFRVEVGLLHGMQPNNLVGAIANEAGIESQYIGRIQIRDDYSLVDLPKGMPKEVYRQLQKVWVVGHQLRLHRENEPVPFAGKPSKHLSAPPAADELPAAKPFFKKDKPHFSKDKPHFSKGKPDFKGKKPFKHTPR